MIALDTNLLVYAHREDSPHHVSALDLLGDLARGRRDWAIPWPCLHEFLAVVTHPRIYVPPTSADSAVAAVEALVATPRLRLLGEGQDHLRQLAALLASGQITGPRVHDARIAAICLSHGVSELWSADRDFSWFPALKVVNPLVG
jgi:toxin-antitoxin system PIN domain toxin